MAETAGELALESVHINPKEVLPGGTVTVTAIVRETAEFVSPADPDLCSPGAVGSGISAEVTVDPQWTSAEVKTTCVPVWALTNGRKELEFRFTAPSVAQTTSYTIETQLRTTASQKGPVINTQQTTVTGANNGGQAGCSVNSDCPSGTHCVAGECVPVDGSGGGGGGGGPQGPADQISKAANSLALLGGIGLAYKFFGE